MRNAKVGHDEAPDYFAKESRMTQTRIHALRNWLAAATVRDGRASVWAAVRAAELFRDELDFLPNYRAQRRVLRIIFLITAARARLVRADETGRAEFIEQAEMMARKACRRMLALLDRHLV